MMPAELFPGYHQYLPDDTVAAQKSLYWPTDDESGIGSSTSSNSSLIGEDLSGSCESFPAIAKPQLEFISGHKKLNRSSSEPRRRQHANGNHASKYKTELCHTFSEHGSCKYAEKCQYAHGEAELREVQRHPKYKTELCKTFHSTAICPYGHRCHFIHHTTANMDNLVYDQPKFVMSAYSSLKDLTASPVPCSSPASGSFFPFDGYMSPFFDSNLSLNSPPPSPIETRLPIFNKISNCNALPFGGLTA